MNIPQGYTEEEVVKIIDKALKGFCHKFRFGYFEHDDIYQEGFIIAMDVLEKYNGKDPLENFLRVHIRNRLINFKHNKYSRHEPPCTSCPFYDPDKKLSNNQCSEFIDKEDCDRWASWVKRNSAKENLMRPMGIDAVSEEESLITDELFNKANFAEIRRQIDRNLDSELRADFLRMLEGIYIPNERKNRVKDAIKEMGVLNEFEDR